MRFPFSTVKKFNQLPNNVKNYKLTSTVGPSAPGPDGG